MKNILLVSLLFFGTTSFAESDFQLLTSSSFEVYSKHRPGSYEAQCSGMLAQARQITTQNNNECSVVLVKTSTFSHSSGGTLVVEKYCKRRPFTEVAMVSLLQKCTESPQPECFNPDLIKQINKVKPPKYKYVNQGTCKYKY